MPSDAPALDHRQRADLALGEQGDRLAHRRVAAHGQHLAPLALEDRGDGHGCASSRRSEIMRTRALMIP